MTLHISEPFQVVHMVGDNVEDTVVTVKLERRRLFTDTIISAEAVFRYKTWRSGDKPAGGGWHVLDTKASSREIVDELYGNGGSKVFWHDPGVKAGFRRLFKSVSNREVREWARKHVEFGIRPYYGNIQLYYGYQFIIGMNLYTVPIINGKKMFRDDIREGVVLQEWKIIDVLASKLTDTQSKP